MLKTRMNNMAPPRNRKNGPPDGDDPLWYQDAIIYEFHVRSFFDSDGDGIGDLKGATQKLGYLQDLGVNTLWLLPFCPSPLKDDGYDISNYKAINPDYGTMADFKKFLKEAHAKGFKIITELVLNHTSDLHPWFQRARRAKPGTVERDFYVWSQDPNKYKEARIIFPDFESSNWTWDSVAQAYYWHRFFHHQPDLNFENPEVQKQMMAVVDFWFELGVDGLRLDAIPYLFEQEGTDCVGLPRTHAFLKMLRRHVDQNFKNKMFLAEANMWPEDAVSFFGNGDECHMSFHFPLMPRLFMALKMEDKFPLEEILRQTPQIPENCQWANFLRNHDELTLEMVTDEERDYMYRAFVHDPQAKINAGIRRRLSPLLRSNRRQIELLNGLLLSLIGTPVIYYGDEIGMGDNIYLGDRNGVRTPMQWSPDRNAGFSKTNPQKLVYPVNIDPEFHYEANNVEAQVNNPHSLLWWMRRLIGLRKRYRAFSRGTLEFLSSENHRVLAFTRRYQGQTILVVANLSRYSQATQIDLQKYIGKELMELFGQNVFPTVKDQPYFLTLGPHSFFWFSLREPREIPLVHPAKKSARAKLPFLQLEGSPEKVLTGKNRARILELLPDYLREQHWFAGRHYKIREVEILGEISLFSKGFPGFLLLTEVKFVDHESQAYLIGLIFGPDEKLKAVLKHNPQHVLARVEVPEADFSGGLYNAISEPQFCKVILDYMENRRTLKGGGGEIVAYPTRKFAKIKRSSPPLMEPVVLQGGQTNTLVAFGKTFLLKIFRQLEWGTNPDLEIGRFLSERDFPHTPPLAGVAEFVRGKESPVTLALLYGFVPNQGEAWDYTQEHLEQFFEEALQSEKKLKDIPLWDGSLFSHLERDPPDWVKALFGPYLISVSRMGEITAKFHRVLAGEAKDPVFAPEPIDPHYQRSFFEAVKTLINRTFRNLRADLNGLPKLEQDLAGEVLSLERAILKKMEGLIEEKIEAMRIRCHGDFHLRQLLHTGNDFVLIDFEGEPGLHWSVRKLKRSPFRDVASMLRSFHYAVQVRLDSEMVQDLITIENAPLLRQWSRFWYQWVASTYLGSYLKESGPCPYLPQTTAAMEVLLTTHIFEKCIYEISFELEYRPQFLKIPLQGILQLMGK